MKSSFTILPQVLERIPILIFAGDQDLICNHVGLETMIRDLEWNGQKGLGVSEFLHCHMRRSDCVCFSESRNAVMECRFYVCWYMGRV